MSRRRVVALAVTLAVGAVCLPGTAADAAARPTGMHTSGRNWG